MCVANRATVVRGGDTASDVETAMQKEPIRSGRVGRCARESVCAREHA